MTAGLRRGPRRCQPNHLSRRLAAIRCYGAAHLGTVKAYLLGKNRFREMVALALFLIQRELYGKGLSRKFRWPKPRPAKFT
jgi:hypothetical protein